MQWSVDLHPVTGEWRIIDREGEIVCVSLHGEKHLAKIAAAPDLYAALVAAKAFHDRDSGCNGFTADYECLRAQIDAALKAVSP